MSESTVREPPRVGGQWGDYQVLRELASSRTWLARGRSNRLVVLKLLEEDCLLEGHLHPAIRERLARVRELPDRNVANLHGVERDGAVALLVWDYVIGRSLAEYPAGADLRQLAREVILAVEGLHARGIVHGAIHGGNIILDERGRIRLTHVSPLLYTDIQYDADGVIDALRDAAQVQGMDGNRNLAELLNSAQQQRWTLRRLAERIAESPAPADRDAIEPPGDDGIRRSSLLWAALAAAIALGVVLAVQWYVGGAAHP